MASNFAQVAMHNCDFPFPVTVSKRNIKEILNQPHKHYVEKNESILRLKSMFEESKFQGELTRRADEDFNSFLFETEIANEPSWFIVRKYDRGNDYLVYSISDQQELKSHIMSKENL